MKYYFNKALKKTFDNAIANLERELEKEGFTVLTEINVGETLEQEMGSYNRRCRILGVCNVGLAHIALQADKRIGLLIPCKIMIQEENDGTVEVAALDPLAMVPIAEENIELMGVAEKMAIKLAIVINNV